MIDECLEKSRRTAWARFYQARRDLEQMQMWAAELAEWLDELVDDLPPAAAELADLCREGLHPHAITAIGRYVAHKRRESRQIGAP